MRRDAPAEATGQAFMPVARMLPKGYRVINFNSASTETEAKGSNNRFIISDGIAWVSVVVTLADKPHVDGFTEGFWPQMGANATYVIRRDNHYITVMGEVPPAVVKSIAQAVRPE
jgi:negative regulator of sigma E activity